MSSNIIGAICAMAIVLSGIGCYFIGRTQGIEWCINNIKVNVELRKVNEDADNSVPGEQSVLQEGSAKC